MAPLTSPSGCVSCARLANKVAELEGRISTLYHIQDAETLMDTIIFGPAQPDTTCARLPVAAAPCPAVAAAVAASPPEPDVTARYPVADVPPPVTVPDDSWTRLEAKPKALVSSTPSHHESWSLVGARSRKERRSSRVPPHHNIQLENKYSILDPHVFPPLAAASQSPPPSPLSPRGSHSSPYHRISPSPIPEHPARIRARRSVPHFTPAPRRAPTCFSVHSSPSTPSLRMKSPPSATPPSTLSRGFPNESKPATPMRTAVTERAGSSPVISHSTSPRPLFDPTTLIVGDSIIRNIHFFNAATRCFPGATVPDILLKLPCLLRALPTSVQRIIVHVGCNDTVFQQSELTKIDFNNLLNFLNSCGKTALISGPIPSLGRGSERFSRVLSLHTWLQSACRAHNVGFIDNFNLFWERASYFKSDGIHPNKKGSLMLAANLQHAVQSYSRD